MPCHDSVPVWARLRAFAVVFAVLALLATAAGARAATVVDQAVAALRSDPVYVAPGATPSLSPAQADQLRSLISQANAGPIYVAVLPASARNQAGGDSTAVAQAIGRSLGQGTVAVVVGGQFRAVSSVLVSRPPIGALPRTKLPP